MNDKSKKKIERQGIMARYRPTYPHEGMDHQLGDVLGPSTGILLKIQFHDCGLSSFCRQPMTPAYSRTIVDSLDDSDLLIRNLDDQWQLRDRRGCLGQGCSLQRGPTRLKDRRLTLVNPLSFNTDRRRWSPLLNHVFQLTLVDLHGGYPYKRQKKSLSAKTTSKFKKK
jgi:hypothetical protein